MHGSHLYKCVLSQDTEDRELVTSALDMFDED